MSPPKIATDYREKLRIIERRASQGPDLISPKQLDYLSQLVDVAEQRREKGIAPDRQLPITDILNDPDDQNAFLAMTLFMKLGLLDIKTVLCSNPYGGYTTEQRAKYLDEMLREHGIDYVKTVPGFAYNTGTGKFNVANDSVLSLNAATRDLCHDLTTDEFYKDVTVVCLAPPYDIAAMINEGGFSQMKRFVFQSGVNLSKDGPKGIIVDMDERILENGETVTNYNANGDPGSSVSLATKRVYDHLNRHANIEAMFVNKYAAGKAPVDGSAWFRRLGRIGDLVGTRTTIELASSHQKRLIDLFSAFCGAGKTQEARMKSPAAWRDIMTRVFGISDESAAEQPDPKGECFGELILKLVSEVKLCSMYDPLAFLFSIDDVVKEFQLFSEPSIPGRVEIDAYNINAGSARTLLKAAILGAALLGQDGM